MFKCFSEVEGVENNLGLNIFAHQRGRLIDIDHNNLGALMIVTDLELPYSTKYLSSRSLLTLPFIILLDLSKELAPVLINQLEK